MNTEQTPPPEVLGSPSGYASFADLCEMLAGDAKKTDDGTPLKSTDLFSLLVAAFTAGEKLGHENAKEIYWTTYSKEKVEDAAPKYAKAILSENDQAIPPNERK